MHDYHVHTVLCRHAEGEAADYVAAAARQGLSEVCFTDHIPAPDGYDPEYRMVLEEFPAYLDIVGAVSRSSSPRVFLGIEADYYPHGMAFVADWLPRQPFDLVLGSVHYIGDWAFDNPREAATWDSVDVSAAWREYFQLIAEMADTRLFDVVGHLDLPKKFGHRPPDGVVREIAKPALDRIAAARMGIEISTAGLRKPVREIYPSPLLLELAFERGIPICFGSDAHRPEEVGYAFGQALALARQAGYREMLRMRKREKTQIALPLDEDSVARQDI